MKEFDRRLAQFQNGDTPLVPRVVIHLRDLPNSKSIAHHQFVCDQLNTLANSIENNGPGDSRLQFYRDTIASYYVGQEDFVLDPYVVPTFTPIP